MTLDPGTMFAALFGAIVTAGFGVVGWWCKRIFRTLDQHAEAIGKGRDELSAHKLFAAETYVRNAELVAMKEDIIKHIDRVAREVERIAGGRHAGE